MSFLAFAGAKFSTHTYRPIGELDQTYIESDSTLSDIMNIFGYHAYGC